jgi:hypothetical protein
MSFETFLDQYIATALWSTNDNADEQGGEPLDANYGPDDIAPETLATMRAECQAFYDAHSETWSQDRPSDCDNIAEPFWSDEQAGHDFWLTRNGHGAGFWDRHSKGRGRTIGKVLTDASHVAGERDLYIGDDGKVWQS